VVLRAARRPHAVNQLALARGVPPLCEVVVDVARRRPAELGIDVVIVLGRVGRAMPAVDDRHAVEVDAPDERDLAGLAGVDDPALLVLATLRLAVPPRAECRSALGEPGALGRVAGKVLPSGRRRRVELRIAPEHDTHVEPPRDGAIEYVEERAAPI